MRRRPLFDPDVDHRARQILRPEGPIGMSPATWWRWTREGRLPPPLRLGTGLTVWRGADLPKAIASRPTSATHRKNLRRTYTARP
jgi:prophage regulatory protein